ncbi:PLP-dependent transferase [Candidatus Sumerlaeota bacterium]|nr:PLP-dependent transferase [Candidatus Sumerlaeota bacterium]
MRFETKAIRLAHTPDPTTNAVISALHLSTTYQFDEVGKNTGYDYGRSINPTRIAMERVLAGLEDGEHCISFSSGMAATDALLSVLVPGDEVVSARNLYGGTIRLFESIYIPRGVKFIYVDGTAPDDFAKVITPRTRMVWLETPTNPQLQIFDIALFSDLAKAKGTSLIVDNTFASPYCQQPLALGADVVLHSTTKYIAGHHDVIGGALITSNAWWNEKMRFFQNTAGAVPGPFDCYQTIRGLKTLAIRMRAHEANAVALARHLEKHPFVKEVLFPGLANHPQHELAKKQMTGFGGMLSFNIRAGSNAVNALAKALRVFHFAESLGGTESLICHPTTMSHAVMTEEDRQRAGITEAMIRVSVGIEHPDDLIEDIDRALAAAQKA